MSRSPVSAVVIPNADNPESSRWSGRWGVAKLPKPCGRGGLTSSPRNAALPVGWSSSGNGSVSLLIGLLVRVSIHELPVFEGSASLSLPKLLIEAFSFGPFRVAADLVAAVASRDECALLVGEATAALQSFRKRQNHHQESRTTAKHYHLG